MQRALITGGAGFIGSHLAEALLDRGCQVEIVDDLSTGAIDNVAHLKGHARFSYALDTVLNRPLMTELIDRADAVFHLAAAVGVRLIVEEPVRTIETNIKATEVVLDLAARKRKPLLLASTSEVYGKLTTPAFHEDDDLILGPTSRARWCYAASKIIDEFLAKAYFRQKGLPAVIVRIFNAIGPRQAAQYGMVVPRFVRQALAGEPITVYGDGSQRRSFTWVGDIVQAMLGLIEHPDAPGEVFNVGHREDIAILDLARRIKEMTGSASPIVFVPYERAYEAGFEDMARRRPDIAKIERVLGYAPSLGLDEMLARVIDHARLAMAERQSPRPPSDLAREPGGA